MCVHMFNRVGEMSQACFFGVGGSERGLLLLVTPRPQAAQADQVQVSRGLIRTDK